jgi:plasmid stabilization system protein ParE
MVQVKITTKAKKDIAGIYKYILKDSYQNAELVAELIIKKLKRLKGNQTLEKLLKNSITQS